MNGVWEVKWAKTRLGCRGPGSGPGTQWVPGAYCPYLRDVGEADQVGDDADDSNEELPAVAEEFGVLVHQGGDEALHSAELQGEQGSATAEAPTPTTHSLIGGRPESPAAWRQQGPRSPGIQA